MRPKLSCGMRGEACDKIIAYKPHWAGVWHATTAPIRTGSGFDGHDGGLLGPFTSVRRAERIEARGGGHMKEKIMEALNNEELKNKLLAELEVEELEERVATKRLCYMPVP